MVVGKQVAIFEWESAPREGQKIPFTVNLIYFSKNYNLSTGFTVCLMVSITKLKCHQIFCWYLKAEHYLGRWGDGGRFREEEISKYIPSLAFQMGKTICLEVPIISLTKIKKDITILALIWAYGSE